MNLSMVMVVNLERGEASTLAELAAAAEQAGRVGVYALREEDYACSNDAMEVEE